MSIYDKPVWGLMREMVEDMAISKGDILTRSRGVGLVQRALSKDQERDDLSPPPPNVN